MLSGPPTQSPPLDTTALANFLGGIGVLGGMGNFEQTQEAETRAGIPEGYLQFERTVYKMMRDKMKGGPVQMFNSMVAPPLISPTPAAGAADPIAQAAGMTPPAWWK